MAAQHAYPVAEVDGPEELEAWAARAVHGLGGAQVQLTGWRFMSSTPAGAPHEARLALQQLHGGRWGAGQDAGGRKLYRYQMALELGIVTKWVLRARRGVGGGTA